MKQSPFSIHRLHRHVRRHLFPKKPRSRWPQRFLMGLYVVLGGICTIFFLFLLLSPSLPDLNNLQNLMAAQSSIVYDRKGEILYTFHGEENRKVVSLGHISPDLIHATLAIEDDQFYSHFGLDIPALLKAVCGEFRLCARRGGSTITQQFAKNAFLNPERTYLRKLKEIFLALKLESGFSKDEILEMYLNRINYGSNIYGVELASQTFFKKPAKDLDVLESAILAAIPKAPTFYSPYGSNKFATINLSEEEIARLNIQSEQDLVAYSSEFINKGLLGKTYTFGDGKSIYVKGRTDFVLERMKELGFINGPEMTEALAQASAKEFGTFQDAFIASHFILHVRELLETRYGKEVVERGGLKITTTLDIELQKAAEESVARYAEDNEKRLGVNNAALVAMDPENGQVLAMVGSRDFANDDIDGKVDMVFRPRLPGSSFKPFVYATAFLKGYSPATVLYDVETKFGDTYQPRNFDGEFVGPISIREALAQSRNIPALKTAYLAGLDNVLDLARELGLPLNQPDDWYGLSLAIGAGEVELMDMVRAYGTFANGGYQISPVVILKIEDRNGNILEEYEPPEERELILDPQVAYLINHVLSDAGARPEGFWRDILTIPGQINAAKTGTSNKKKKNDTATEDDDNVPFDAWTLGYTRGLVAGVWAGNTDGSPLKPVADGLNAAGKPWHDFMVEALKGKSREEFDQPEGIRFVRVSKRSGKLPSELTAEEDIIPEVFASFSVPKEEDDSYQVVEIDTVSGKLATEFTPEPARERKAFYRHHSELPHRPEWEDPVRKWAEENGQEEEPPIEYDDVHTAESEDVKPDIRIVSPSPESTVALPYVGVTVALESPAGVAQVDYYWDDELMESVKKAPYQGHLSLPSSKNPEGSSHTIKAVVFDSLYHSNQASVSVRIGSDAVPPEVHFVYPHAGVSLAPHSLMSAQVDAFDPNGDVQKVEWAWDDQVKQTQRQAPYVWSFEVPLEAGEHRLRATATDYSENQTSAEIKVLVTDGVETPPETTQWLGPKNNASFDLGEPVPIKIQLDTGTLGALKEMLVFAKLGKGTPVQIARTLRESELFHYTFLWPNPSVGRYELFYKIILQNGEIRFSDRVPIVVKY